jgi:hypothetical protein
MDIDALRNLLTKLSFLGSEVPELVELEFNPVISLPERRGYQIIDVRARVAPVRRIL